MVSSIGIGGGSSSRGSISRSVVVAVTVVIKVDIVKQMVNRNVCMCAREGICRAKGCVRERPPFTPGQKTKSISELGPMALTSLG